MRSRLAPAVLFAAVLLAGAPGSAQQRWHKAYFPNVDLVTQDGRKVRFYDDVIKGKVVAINFIYTKCPDVCPLDTAALRRVQKLIGSRMGREVHFYSISLDPKNDTPAQLKKYMRTFDVGPGWTFLTGRPQDLALIQSKFGIKPVSAGMLTAHDTRFVLGNEPMARWVKRTPHDNPHVLAHILTSDLASPGMRRDAGPQRVAAGSSRIEGVTEAAKLYMSRCSACHTIGGGDGKLGPDLAGVVERRPRAWLHRWIKEPDRMMAEKDPTVVAMVAKYRGLPMPNLKLSNADVAALIGYIGDETRRQRAITTKVPAKTDAGAHVH